MNALAPRTDFNAAYDTAAYEQALRNLNAHQPAFWTTRSFNHVGANELRDRANQHVGIEAGIASIPECYAAVAEWIDLNTIAALDTLVPLNDEAVSDLMDAYEIAGTFRSAQELSDRRSVSLLDAVNARRVA